LNLPRIVLASASPRRRDLLQQEGYEVVIAVSGVEELEFSMDGPAFLALENARRKWRPVARQYPDWPVVAADTVVWLGGQFYGKPKDMLDAQRMLAELSGKTHSVVTGVVAGKEGEFTEFAETSLVTFRELSEEEICNYLNDIHPFDKAGAYAAQNDGGRIIQKIDGLLSNVIGLPVERLRPLWSGETIGGNSR